MGVKLYCLKGWYYEHVYQGGVVRKRSLRTRDKARAEHLITVHQKMIDDSVLCGNTQAKITQMIVPEYRNDKGGDFKRLSSEVLQRYTKAFVRFLEFCEKRRIEYVYHVTKNVSRDYIKQLKSVYSDGTVRGQMMALSAIWRSNGLESVWSSKDVVMRVVECRRSNITQEEIDEILYLSEKNDSKDIFGVLLIGARLGMRLGDICTLRFDEIKRGRIEKNLRKTGFFLSIKMPKEVRDFINSKRTKSDWVFARLAKMYLDQKRWKISRLVNHAIGRVIPKRIEQVAGRVRGASRYSFHSLRHSFIVRLLEAGIKPHVVKELAGVSVSLIMSRYGDHVKQSDKDLAIKEIYGA